jgi:predicted RNase H-like nuclease (RuvC/YqgF family)
MTTTSSAALKKAEEKIKSFNIDVQNLTKGLELEKKLKDEFSKLRADLDKLKSDTEQTLQNHFEALNVIISKLGL